MTETQPVTAAESEKHYELRISGKQVLLRILPPGDGRRASLSEIQRELRQHDVNYRHDTLFDIYRRASNEFEPLASQEITRFTLSVEVSEDQQQAFLTVVAPDKGEDQLTPARVKDALEEANVQKGIRYEPIKDVLLHQKSVERTLVAQGVPVEHGVDGGIELQQVPVEQVLVEDNRADYRELNLIKNVAEGDLIALITYPKPGKDGFDVHGKVLRARPGKKARLKVGRNVRMSEDGDEMFAARAGYVVRSGDRISVENVLLLDNVDSTSGNVRFHGVVRVHGQVEDGFVVEAEKGIEVAGSVGKATLRCKGDIRIKGGAFGATLECRGTLYARFLSECTARAEGHVVVDEYSLHSDVVAKRALKVTREPKGFITGGRARAGTSIEAPNVGSDVSEVRTLLEVGVGVDVRKRYDAVQERIDSNLETFEKVRRNLAYLQQQRESGVDLDAAKSATYDRMLGAARQVIEELHRHAATHHELLEELGNPSELVGIVVISQRANVGTSIQIQTAKANVREPLGACGFALLNGALKGVPFNQAQRMLRTQNQQRALRARVPAP